MSVTSNKQLDSPAAARGLPHEAVPKFVVFDHDAKYGFAVPATIEPMQITPVRTSIGRPWRNGVAERWVAVAAVSCSTT
jgi:hypothetical protein